MKNVLNDRPKKGDPNYCPTAAELGISNEEYERILYDPERGDPYLDRMMDRWRARYAKRQSRLNEAKAARLAITQSAHWYNRLTESDLIQVVENMSSEFVELFDYVIQKETLPKKKEYYALMKDRVINGRPRLRICDDKKLTRFPRMNEHKKLLVGSRLSKVTFLGHVFSPRY